MTEEEKKAIIRRLVDEDRERTFRDRHSTTEDVLVEGDKVVKSLRSGFQKSRDRCCVRACERPLEGRR